jgi:catechol 2,3-dioxygenase-like lactoylglutathione lyase family enzyme
MIDKLDTLMIGVRDMAAMTAFYRDVLGLPVRFASPPYWTSLDLNGIQIGLHGGGDTPPQAGWLPSFTVSDLKSFRAHLEANGVAIEGDYHETPRGTILTFHDPEGNGWQAMQLGAKPADLK